MREIDDLAVGIDLAQHSPVVVVLDPDRLLAARIEHRQQAVTGVVSERAGLVFAIAEADEIAVRVVGIDHCLAERIGDLRDATERVAREDHAPAARVNDSLRRDCESVVVTVLHALQAALFIDDVTEAVRSCKLEPCRIVDVGSLGAE